MTSTNSKVPLLESFAKSQFSSMIATGVDFVIFIFLNDVLQIYYVFASGISAFFGALVSFILGRNWAFRKKDGKLSTQAFRYFLTSGTSILLNTAGIYILTETIGTTPLVSKIIISILVGVFFNFFMYRHFVYK